MNKYRLAWQTIFHKVNTITHWATINALFLILTAGSHVHITFPFTDSHINFIFAYVKKGKEINIKIIYINRLIYLDNDTWHAGRYYRGNIITLYLAYLESVNGKKMTRVLNIIRWALLYVERTDIQDPLRLWSAGSPWPRCGTFLIRLDMGSPGREPIILSP